MDVLNAHKLEFYIGVVVFLFIAFPSSSVCHRIQLERTIHSVTCSRFRHGFTDMSTVMLVVFSLLRGHAAGKTQNKVHRDTQHTTLLHRAHLGPGVHHIHEVTTGIGPQDGLQHLLILQAASTEP